MRELEGKTAFVTGAGSGIGLGIARALAGAKVNLALADIEAAPLEAARTEIEALGVGVTATLLDVADREAMYQAAEDVERHFGRVDLLVNNAGVGFVGTPLDEISDRDFDWVIGVNLFGVIHGIKAFVPRIKRHGEGGHVVNTSSIGGFQVKPGWNHGLYALTKYAVVALSEGLEQDLEPHGIGVSVLAPAAVRSHIYQAGRNRPERHGGPFRRPEDHPVAGAAAAGMSPDAVGERVLGAIRRNELYIFTHPETREWLEQRHRRILAAYEAAD
jgi:NAD(P)-dependent dehydrogenase (short-subunit alcohol dehydrogenase family)